MQLLEVFILFSSLFRSCETEDTNRGSARGFVFFSFLRGDVAKEKEEGERFCGICEENLDKNLVPSCI
jgi:hypothetical protein